MITNQQLLPQDLACKINKLWAASCEKNQRIDHEYDPKNGTPVFAVEGKHMIRG